MGSPLSNFRRKFIECFLFTHSFATDMDYYISIIIGLVWGLVNGKEAMDNNCIIDDGNCNGCFHYCAF